MEKVLLLDTSVGSLNKGDDIIMECVKKELAFILDNRFILNLPTHVSSFHWYQVARDSSRVQQYATCPLKFVGGTNLLVKDMFTHYPQWNINLFNYQIIKGCILVGVGAGAGDKSNWYTRLLYKSMLNQDYYHSVRDERSKKYVESLGLKAINTGCTTMWMLTPDFCNMIPVKKSNRVIFTLTASDVKDKRDQRLIDILNENYSEIYFWIQGNQDYEYLHKFKGIEQIKCINSTVNDYLNILKQNDIDYVGTRLHAGVYAMRHGKRSIIIAVDERAREINKCNNLNCVEKDDMLFLDTMINDTFKTEIKMPFAEIEAWKNQFVI